jgi:hypothetical protein
VQVEAFSCNSGEKLLIVPQMGQEIYSLMAASDTLKARPRWALAVIASLRKSGWIAVEAQSLANVEELCQNISTVIRPMDICLVPLEERIDWLLAGKHDAKPTSPGWARIKRVSVLKSLNLKPPLLRYARDLALVTSCLHYPYVDVMVIPRLPVMEPFSGDENQPKPRKRTRRRLLHPYTFPSMRQERIASNFQFDPSLFWSPTKEPKLTMTSPDVYRFKNKNSKVRYRLPFAWFERIPRDALALEDVNPTVGDLDAFFDGMIVGEKELKLTLPPGIHEFLRNSYEHYVGAPLEVGHRVMVSRLQDGPEMGAEVIGVRYDEIDVEVEEGGCITVPTSQARRLFTVGDYVMVFAPTSPMRNREGWVLNVGAKEVAILDVSTKEEVIFGTSLRSSSNRPKV